MKHSFLLATMMAFVTLVGCKNNGVENPVVDGTISVSPRSIIIEKDASQSIVEVTASSAWTATTDAEWLVLSLKSGSGDASVTVMAEANSELSKRYAQIIFTCGEVADTVNVQQAKGESAGGTGGVGGGDFAQITVSNVTKTTADIYWEVADQNQEYVYAIFELGELDGYGFATDEEKAGACVYMYEYYGILDRYIKTGDYGGPFTGFTPGMPYTVYLFAIDSNKKLASDLCTVDFTTDVAPVTDDYLSWVGDWSITSASSLISGKPITLSMQVAAYDGTAQPGYTYCFYGFDISKFRWDLPMEAKYNEETCGWTILGENFLFTDDNGYAYYYNAKAWVDSEEDPGYYFIAGGFSALTAAMGEGGRSATVECGSGDLGEGLTYTVASINLCAVVDGGYYGLANDESLGLADDEMLIGPFTMTKTSDTVYAPREQKAQVVPGFDNVVKSLGVKRVVSDSYNKALSLGEVFGK